ncbi:MAG: hypothetical protein ACE5HE_06965 [Phycisphaerae bacterium]
MMPASEHCTHLKRFYDVLASLGAKVGRRQLKHCHGRMHWPNRGVYFFFEDDEYRSDKEMLRVVHVGTHAVSAGSRTTLWRRLATHRGTELGRGNHRASVFRLWIGAALLARDETLVPKPSTWGKGSSAKGPVREAEAHVEEGVSSYIASMPFLWVEADDEPGKTSIRRVIETNTIALLSCCSETGNDADRPSNNWLGHHCPSQAVQRSGLWNVRDVDGGYDPMFLDLLECCAARTSPP